MGSFSLSYWVIVLTIVLIAFGAGRVPRAMGDLARGVRAFRTRMREDNAPEVEADLAEARPSDHGRG